MRRGEVFWAEHPEWGRRPAVVMTRDEAIGALNEVFAVLATATIRDLPTEVRLGPEDGMPREYLLNLDHVDTVAKGFIGDGITNPERGEAALLALPAMCARIPAYRAVYPRTSAFGLQ